MNTNVHLVFLIDINQAIANFSHSSNAPPYCICQFHTVFPLLFTCDRFFFLFILAFTYNTIFEWFNLWKIMCKNKFVKICFVHQFLTVLCVSHAFTFLCERSKKTFIIFRRLIFNHFMINYCNALFLLFFFFFYLFIIFFFSVFFSSNFIWLFKCDPLNMNMNYRSEQWEKISRNIPLEAYKLPTIPILF